MKSFEINKILGALLGTCLVLVAVHIASGAIFTSAAPAKPGYEIAVKEEQPEQSQGEKKPAEVPIENLLAAASVQQGTQIARQCVACHNFAKGQGKKVGPDLYGVVGRPVASEAGFNYSAPLKAKGGTWTFDALNTWLTNPRADVPGTLMTYAGLSSEKQRADVIAYLNSNSEKPLPLPTAKSEAPPSGPPAGNQNAPAKAAGAPATAPAAPAAPPSNPQAAAPAAAAANPQAAAPAAPATPPAIPQVAAPAAPAAPPANPQAAAPAAPPAAPAPKPQ